MRLQTGGKGKSFNDRELAAEVRTLALKEIKKALKGPDSEFKEQVILRLSNSLLPRLNELTGEDGKAIQIVLAPEIADQNGVKVK